MKIVGCDFHPRWQQIAVFDTETGEISERKLINGKLLMEDRFPRIWRPSEEQRDLRQLLIHRHKLVEIQTRVKNGLQHLALNRGVQKGSRLWSVRGRAALETLPLEGWSAKRRADLLRLLEELDQQVGELDAAVTAAASEHPQARLLMTQPGVGPVTALAFVLTIGDAGRFAHSGAGQKQADVLIERSRIQQ